MNEKSNKLISLFASLDRTQLRSCRKLVQSPFFSSNEDLLRFFDEIAARLERKASLDKRQIWQSVFGKNKPYNDVRFRKFTSDLFKLIKDYLVQESLEQEPELWRYLYFSALERQRSTKLIKGIERNWEDLTTVNSTDDGLQYLYLHLLEKKKYQLLNYEQKPGERSNVEDISKSLDTYYFISKLRDATNAKARALSEKQDYSLYMAQEVVAFLDASPEHLNEPYVRAYYYMYKMMAQDENDEAYFNYKEIILNRHELKVATKYNFIQPALNYCAVKISKGQRSFLEDYLEIYKFALSLNMDSLDGFINSAAFKNTVQVAMQLGEFDWAEGYIRTYQDSLPPEERANTVNFNLATIYFYQKKFSEAQEYLREVEYSNIALNLNTKMMLIAIYYELGEGMALESLFDSTIAYLNRHKELPEDRDKNYRNLILYTRRLSRLTPGDTEAYQKLKKEVQHEKYLASKGWLEEKIDSFRP
ncbi:hypothetical protein QWY85_19200 [Neolewinella lacunae]|uniref:Tetratricopeptide repeat protein n=1 Tax=Neolewinella lacunae TaxID=1517758 RepID=A0A923T7T8_9BACT|nr:hypothetical protein [Neolewinella lacunae]MBC6994885.1 hypothetical protein [Neolewinella lacunae]MDN3636805.1 hypothetical protein [Neolewinella lacunae]